MGEKAAREKVKGAKFFSPQADEVGRDTEILGSPWPRGLFVVRA
jgi:hypothetical protein